MHNWKQIVRQHLTILKVCSVKLEEKLAEEFANHLEDSYEERLRAGLAEEAAFQCTLDELKLCRGPKLVLRILREDEMTSFTKKIGLPCLLTFALALVMGRVLFYLHIFHIAYIPRSVNFFLHGMFFSLPIAFMCLLPVCGALGAIISRHNGGSRLDHMTAAILPVVILNAPPILFDLAFERTGVNWMVYLRVILERWSFEWPVIWIIPLLLGVALAELVPQKSTVSREPAGA